LSPILILATNRGEAKIRGSEVSSPHGIPIDLLDRCLIVRTEQYGREDRKEILRIRARDEGVEVDDVAMDMLALVSEKASLRYASMLISLGEIARQRRKGAKVEKDDFAKCYRLFHDQKRMESKLAKNRSDYINDS